MRAPLLSALIVVAGGAAACGGSKTGGAAKTPLSAKDIVQRSSPAIVRIEAGEGTGTGFIIDKSGLIATNLHVVRGKKDINVKLYGGDVFPVREIAALDPERDLALLRIRPPKPLPTLRLGDSDAMTAGDPVVAIGNPLGVFDYSVSNGLVSQVRPVCTNAMVELHNRNRARFEELAGKPQRTPEETEELERIQCSQEFKILQISAPISQGSSGGPLFNQAGEVVGVTFAIVNAGQNINFAIPTNYLKRIASRPAAPLSMDDFAQTTQPPAAAEDPADGPRIVREIPRHATAVFNGCNGEHIADLVKAIWEAIESGAPLYNAGNAEACFRIYEGTATKFERDGGCAGVRTAFGDGLLKANTKETYKEKAWAMRDTFDGLIEAANAWAAAGGKLPNRRPGAAPGKK